MTRNVLITSGGTSEPIDSIRSITNKSTGKLGSLIADAFADSKSVENIYYIHGNGAALPYSDKVIPIKIETVNDLITAIQELFRNKTIDVIIHAMAVSDYRVKAVIPAEYVLKEAAAKPDITAFAAALSDLDIRDEFKKLSSDLEIPILLLEHTPKVLPLLRKIEPHAKLVGFKLLSNVDSEYLIDTAYRLLLQNGCDYVLANDYATILSGNHTGYLINSDRLVLSYFGKEHIARGIVETILGEEIGT